MVKKRLIKELCGMAEYAAEQCGKLPQDSRSGMAKLQLLSHMQPLQCSSLAPEVKAHAACAGCTALGPDRKQVGMQKKLPHLVWLCKALPQ